MDDISGESALTRELKRYYLTLHKNDDSNPGENGINLLAWSATYAVILTMQTPDPYRDKVADAVAKAYDWINMSHDDHTVTPDELTDLREIIHTWAKEYGYDF